MKPTRSQSSHRRLQLLDDPNQDPYRLGRKLSEPSHCTECGAVFRRGRWHWEPQAEGSSPTRCPACHRASDNLPAGIVHIEGAFATAHRTELLSTVRNREARAKSEHPLERIIGIEEHADRIRVTTTDPHLARGIGEALHAAYQGELDLQYGKGDEVIEVRWTR